ncbi:MarR family winged helix-turn-helix transcriptional regulator [Lacticaseibacillus saniviri]
MEDFSFADRPDKERLTLSLGGNTTINPETASLYIDLQWTYLEMQKQYEAVLSQFELSESRFLIMMFLSHSPNWSLTPSEIADKLGATRATASKLLKALEQKQWVVKTTSPADKRSSLVQLTEAGNQVLTTFLPHNFDVIAQMMHYLTPEDIKQFTTLLDKLKHGTQDVKNEMEHSHGN